LQKIRGGRGKEDKEKEIFSARSMLRAKTLLPYAL